MKKVAVTGDLASGKTTLCQFFKERGQYVLSADAIVHELLIPTSDLGKKVIALLGSLVVVDNKFDRKKIADIVFQDDTLLEKLERLIHPQVQKAIEMHYRKVIKEQSQCSLFVVEIPLLFEGNFENFFDVIILMTAEDALCRERYRTRENREDYNLRGRRFIPRDEKIDRAHFVLHNNQSKQELKANFETIYEQLTRVQ